MIDSGGERTKKLVADYHSVMPSFNQLKDEELDQLISFLHTQKAKQKPKDDPNAIKNPIPEKIPALTSRLIWNYLRKYQPAVIKNHSPGSVKWIG